MKTKLAPEMVKRGTFASILAYFEKLIFDSLIEDIEKKAKPKFPHYQVKDALYVKIIDRHKVQLLDRTPGAPGIKNLLPDEAEVYYDDYLTGKSEAEGYIDIEEWEYCNEFNHAHADVTRLHTRHAQR